MLRTRMRMSLSLFLLILLHFVHHDLELFFFFFFNDPPPAEFYPLPLPAALPIPETELPLAPAGAPYEPHDLAGAWVTPGLIDCHTHLVFAGTRANEYAQRLRGRSYEEIARAGDRKSTRLNSSHSQISYAVFCLKQ